MVADPFVGAKALWRPEAITDVVVAFADPGAVGLAGVAGHLQILGRHEPGALRLRLAPPHEAKHVVTAALAPGLVVTLGIDDFAVVPPDEEIEYTPGHGSVALDGEREIEVHADQTVRVRLSPKLLRTIDIAAVMHEAATCGLLSRGTPPPPG
jgi:hypothetical protein